MKTGQQKDNEMSRNFMQYRIHNGQALEARVERDLDQK